jgi:hypothetical protein
VILRLKVFREQGTLRKGFRLQVKCDKKVSSYSSFTGRGSLLETQKSLVQSHQKIGYEEVAEADFKRK